MPTAASFILHIAPRDRWRAHHVAGTDYVDPSLDTEGFIHCSTRDQVLGPADALFAGRDDLVLLVIDPTRVDAEIVYEDCYDHGEAFPHLYGPLPVDAVVQVIDFPCGSGGTFVLPSGLG